jgi:uncharacterized protein YbjT (DUF2867 family)
MTSNRTILITGATGNQGGAVAQALQGVDIAKGDLHFDNKWRIEETVRGLRFPSHVILRPVFFMENLLAPFSLQGSRLAWALGQGTKLQMIAVEDIGWFDARAFTDAGDREAPCDGRDDEARAVRGRARQNRATSGRGDDTAGRRDRVPAPECGPGLEGHRREPARRSWDVDQCAGSKKTQVTRQDRASCGLE